MNKKELIEAVAEKAGMSRAQAARAVDATLTAVADALADGQKVQLLGFGTFEIKERAARVGRKPSTGETIEIPAKKTPSFKAGKGFKDQF